MNHEHDRSRRRRIAAAAFVAILLAGVGVAMSQRGSGDRLGEGGQAERDPDLVSEPLPSTRPVTATADDLVDLAALPERLELGFAPGAWQPGSVYWTGSEFLSWETSGPQSPRDQVVGVALNPATGVWRDLAAPPTNSTRYSAVAWGGTEMLICCGNGFAHAYDPLNDSWRTLAEPPVTGHARGVWTGAEYLLVASNGAAAYDPVADVWEFLPGGPELDDESGSAASVTWSGDTFYVWPSPSSGARLLGAGFDLTTRTWADLARPPEEAWPAVPSIAWAGSRLVLAGGLPAPSGDSERLVGVATREAFEGPAPPWLPLTGSVPDPERPEGNLGSQTLLWTGDELLLHAGGLASGLSPDGALFKLDQSQLAWTLLGDTAGTALRPIVNAGPRVLWRSADGRLVLATPEAIAQHRTEVAARACTAGERMAPLRIGGPAWRAEAEHVLAAMPSDRAKEALGTFVGDYVDNADSEAPLDELTDQELERLMLADAWLTEFCPGLTPDDDLAIVVAERGLSIEPDDAPGTVADGIGDPVSLPDCAALPDSADPECDDLRGFWALHPSDLAVAQDATSVRAFVAYPARRCGARAGGRIGTPRIVYSADRIEIDMRLADHWADLDDDAEIPCPGFPAQAVTIELAEPVGGREIVPVALTDADWQGDEWQRPVSGPFGSVEVTFSVLVVDGLRPVLGPPEPSTIVPAGDVIRLDPPAETALEPGSDVVVIVSSGLPDP